MNRPDRLGRLGDVACDVRAWIAACYSYNHLARWRANFLNTRQDVILYSSSGDVPSRGYGFVTQVKNLVLQEETHFSEIGLFFTQQVTSNRPPTFTPYAFPVASTGPQIWERRAECQPLTPGRE